MTAKAKHTPGPWNIVPVFAGYAINGYRIYAGDEIVARTHAVDEGYDEANATLISAAPDLLQALKRLVARVDPDYTEAETLEAKAAIDKALGEAP